MIEGVILTPLKQILDERGKVMHMLRKDDVVFKKFGEIYFSCVHSGIIKGWHLHKKMILNYAVIYGKIKLVLFDDRKNSKTRGQTNELFLGPENYQLVTIPPNIWNAFQGLGTETSIVANCSTITHDAKEIVGLDPYDKKIPYKWDSKIVLSDF